MQHRIVGTTVLWGQQPQSVLQELDRVARLQPVAGVQHVAGVGAHRGEVELVVVGEQDDGVGGGQFLGGGVDPLDVALDIVVG